MTFNKFLEMYEISLSEFSKVTKIPLRQVYRYSREGVQPSLITIVKIKAFTDGKVQAEDWLNDDDNKPRPSIQDLKLRYFGKKGRDKESL